MTNVEKHIVLRLIGYIAGKMLANTTVPIWSIFAIKELLDELTDFFFCFFLINGLVDLLFNIAFHFSVHFAYNPG